MDLKNTIKCFGVINVLNKTESIQIIFLVEVMFKLDIFVIVKKIKKQSNNINL